MARTKRGSNTLDKGNKRLAGMKAINPALDLGGDLNVVIYAEILRELSNKLEEYNVASAKLDALGNEVTVLEKRVALQSSRMLAAVAAHFSKDSKEYEMAGGTPSSEIRRGARKTGTKKE